MSRTDRPRTRSAAQALGGWIQLRGPGFRVNWVRPRNKADRQRVRVALHRGDEPEPRAHRHGALWDRF